LTKELLLRWSDDEIQRGDDADDAFNAGSKGVVSTLDMHFQLRPPDSGRFMAVKMLSASVIDLITLHAGNSNLGP